MKYFPPTELALNSKGAVYHLGLLPEQLAEKIILVGDQDRVALVSSFLTILNLRVGTGNLYVKQAYTKAKELRHYLLE